MSYSKDYRPSLVALARRLAQARAAKGRSQADVASALRMAQSSLSHIERGADTSLSTFLDIGRELGLELMLVPKSVVRFVSELTASENRANTPH